MVISKVAGLRTSGHNQVVVFKILIRALDPASRQIDAGDLGHQNRDVRMTSQDMPNRRGDCWRRQACRGDLIKKGLKYVMIGAVNQRHFNAFSVWQFLGQRVCCGEATKAAADNDDS